MKLVGIDVGKNSHHFCVMDKETGEFNKMDPVKRTQ